MSGPPGKGEQLHYWPNGDAYDAWDVARLIELARDLTPVVVPIDAVREVDTNYWFHGDHEPTVRNLVLHARQALTQVDPAYPVILGPDGRLMDGMHRVVRALLEGRDEILAVRFDELPVPDLVGCALGERPT